MGGAERAHGGVDARDAGNEKVGLGEVEPPAEDGRRDRTRRVGVAHARRHHAEAVARARDLGMAFARPGRASFWVSASPSSQGFASPPNIVMTRTLGAVAELSAAAGRERVAINRAAARTDKRETIAGSIDDFSELVGDSQDFERVPAWGTAVSETGRVSRQKPHPKSFRRPPWQNNAKTL